MQKARVGEGKKLSDVCRDSLAEILSFFDSPRDWLNFSHVCSQLHYDLIESHETVWGMRNILFRVSAAELLSASWVHEITPRIQRVICHASGVTPQKILSVLIAIPGAEVKSVTLGCERWPPRDQAISECGGLAENTTIKELTVRALTASQYHDLGRYAKDLAGAVKANKTLEALDCTETMEPASSTSQEFVDVAIRSKTLQVFACRHFYGPISSDADIRRLIVETRVPKIELLVKFSCSIYDAPRVALEVNSIFAEDIHNKVTLLADDFNRKLYDLVDAKYRKRIRMRVSRKYLCD